MMISWFLAVKSGNDRNCTDILVRRDISWMLETGFALEHKTRKWFSRLTAFATYILCHFLKISGFFWSFVLAEAYLQRVLIQILI